MKILVCTTEYPPSGSGIANVVDNVVKNLKMDGIDCVVCSPIGPDIKIGSIFLIKKFGRLGLLYYWFILMVNQYFYYDYDIIWLHQPLLLKYIPNKKIINTIHITAYGVNKQTLYSNSLISRKVYKLISALIEKICYSIINTEKFYFTSVSGQVSEELKKLGVLEKNNTIIMNGVNINKFVPLDPQKKRIIRKEFGIPPDKIVFISVGNLTITKNHLVLIDIFSKIQKSRNDIYLVIVGDGNQKNKIKKFIQKEDIKNVILLGHVDNKIINRLYSCSDVYIMSSLYEGLPLTLLEALSSGLPCIVPNIKSVKSIINKSKSGIVVNYNNISETESKIKKFLDSDFLKLKKSSRKFAEKNLDWSIISKKYKNLFFKIYND